MDQVRCKVTIVGDFVNLDDLVGIFVLSHCVQKSFLTDCQMILVVKVLIAVHRVLRRNT